jgi:hypothetical protein
VVLSRLTDWRAMLTIVKPDTLTPMASRGIPPVLAVEVAGACPTTSTHGSPAVDCRHGACQCGVGQRIAAELLLKLGLRVSPRTVRRYMLHQRIPRVYLGRLHVGVAEPRRTFRRSLVVCSTVTTHIARRTCGEARLADSEWQDMAPAWTCVCPSPCCAFW